MRAQNLPAITLWFGLGLLFMACGGRPSAGSDARWDDADAQEAPETTSTEVTPRMQERLGRIRADWQASPGDPRIALRFGIAVEVGMRMGRIAHPSEQSAELLAEAREMLTVAREKNPNSSSTFWVVQGQLHLAAGDRAAAVKAFEASIATHPSALGLLELLKQRGASREAKQRDCKRAMEAFEAESRQSVAEGSVKNSQRSDAIEGATDQGMAAQVAADATQREPEAALRSEAALSDEDALRYELLHACWSQDPKRPIEEVLGFASEEDRRFFVDEQARQNPEELPQQPESPEQPVSPESPVAPQR